MNELLGRLTSKPVITAELLIASLFANVLALASPLFVIQVLNRYVTYGIDSTLATLTAGVIIAIVLEMGFRQARLLLTASAIEDRDKDRTIGVYGLLVSAKMTALERIPPEARQEIMRGVEAIESAYSASNVGAILDVPFALLFIIALSLLSPILGIIAAAFIIGSFVFALFSQHLIQGPTREHATSSAERSSFVDTADRAADTVRAFGGQSAIMTAWHKHVSSAQAIRQKIERRQGMTQTLTQSLQALMGVAIISVGAILVVMGKLEVGTMIGANIMATRGLGPVMRFAQMTRSFARARQALLDLEGLTDLPQEIGDGTTLQQYDGGLELRDVTFAYAGQTTPLFESLSLNLPSGSILVLRGDNGAGKTTLLRLIAGLIDPVRGHVFGDGVDIQQMDGVWWRRQLAYLPQEPSFLNDTIKANFLAANSDLSEQDIDGNIRKARLGKFIDESQQGLDMVIASNGRTLAVGHRRRLALARALSTGGKLILFDEPTEGLDKDGCAAVYETLKDFATQGCTIVVATTDPVILKGSRTILDLNKKPTPQLLTVAPNQSSTETPSKPGSKEVNL